MRVRPAAWRAVVSPLAARLDAAADEELICGRGGDNPALLAADRARLPSAGLADGRTDGAVTSLSRAAERLAVDACPVCLAHGQMVGRYLAWLAGIGRREPAELRSEPGGVCPDHLRELAVIDTEAGTWVLHREQDRVRARLADMPAAARHPDGRASRRHRRALDEDARTAVVDALTAHRCLACDAADAYVHAESDLLLAALGDPGFARADERSHGMCLRRAAFGAPGSARSGERSIGGRMRHAVLGGPGSARSGERPDGARSRHVSLGALGSARAGGRPDGARWRHGADPPAGAALTGRVLAARLDVCAWELAEAGRKRAWAYRHEAPGPESAAWVRAPALLDGAVYLGGPPRTP